MAFVDVDSSGVHSNRNLSGATESLEVGSIFLGIVRRKKVIGSPVGPLKTGNGI
jgi:hypothetical protein